MARGAITQFSYSPDRDPLKSAFRTFEQVAQEWNRRNPSDPIDEEEAMRVVRSVLTKLKREHGELNETP